MRSKPEPAQRPRRSQGAAGHPMLIGVFIGVLLGLCLALGVALYLNKSNPFVGQGPKQADADEERGRTRRAQAGSAGRNAAARPPGRARDARKRAKPRFDFYDDPSRQGGGGARHGRQRNRRRARQREVYYLQAGAFQKSSDADNLKARLALAGLEAQIQTATLPDNSVWHRVRLGPYTRAPELDQARAVLRENKIEPSVIKVTERDPSAEPTRPESPCDFPNRFGLR